MIFTRRSLIQLATMAMVPRRAYSFVGGWAEPSGAYVTNGFLRMPENDDYKIWDELRHPNTWIRHCDKPLVKVDAGRLLTDKVLRVTLIVMPGAQVRVVDPDAFAKIQAGEL